MSAPDNGRRRRDPRSEPRATRRPVPTPAATERPLVRIDDPAYLVFAVPEMPDGRLSAHDRDLLGAARLLADPGGGAVLAVIFGAPPEELGDAGADRVLVFAGERVAGYAPEARAAAIAEAVTRHGPRHVLFPESPWGGGELGRRVAVRLGERPATHVWRLEDGRSVSRGGGGAHDLARPLPRFLMIDAEAAPPVTHARHEARPLEAPDVSAAPKLEDLGELSVAPGEVALPEAELILAAGDGVADWARFHRLAEALGASEAGSRVVVDAGHLPRERQVGVSGIRVNARCYLALGISGASQHLQGITACERVVAVNLDPHCEMVRRADLAVIGDAQAVMASLLALLAEEEGDG